MKALVACEYSGKVRNALSACGWDATSCDILPTETPGPHYQGDVTDILGEGWDLIIAHPPCTYLSNSGVGWLYKDETRWKKLEEACQFFGLFLNHDCKRIAIENPIMHYHAKDRIEGFRNAEQIVQPYEFGHPESKKTCLWLKGLPKLNPICDVKDIHVRLPKSKSQRIHMMSPGKDRSKKRSETFDGIALAMAAQWTEAFHREVK